MDYKGYFFIMSRQTGMVLQVNEGFTLSVNARRVDTSLSDGPSNNGQLWLYTSEIGELKCSVGHLTDDGFRMALDVSEGWAFNNAVVSLNAANGARSQKWYFQPDGSIQSALGDQWVLDVQEGKTTSIAGTPVILYQRKDGGPSVNQQWDVVPYVPTNPFYIRSALNADCYLQIKGGSDKTSAHLCIGDKGSMKPNWTYGKDDHNIISANGSIGINMPSGWPEDGDTVSLIQNAIPDYLSQKWTFEKTGAIVSGLGFLQWVMDVSGSGKSGSPVILHTWNGGKNQQWFIWEA